MTNKTKVVIAGGGTAGWLAAAALSKQLADFLDITLVESDQIGTVGVGEATIPTMLSFHNIAGIDEREFMRETHATFKLGIQFENWAEEGDSYIHSFGAVGKGTWLADFHHIWMSARDRGLSDDLGDYCVELQAARENKFGLFNNSQERLNYAFHLDAGRYAQFLRKLCQARGVRRVEGKIRSVQQNSDSGFIESLQLDSGDTIPGDFFIDCTGFRALLIEKTLKVGFEDWSHWLPADSAWAVQTESDSSSVAPYTRAIARHSGWQWRIPLQHRVGNGLVYSSDFLSDEQAQTELLKSLNTPTVSNPNKLKFRTGRRRKMWHKNCVALGLSSGFLEPLESTSIHLVMIGVTRLMKWFPFGGVKQAQVDHYNQISITDLEQIRDFIILHYKATKRQDTPFWRYCNSMEIPNSLAHRIELFRQSAILGNSGDELFRIDSWLQVMLGQGIKPATYHRIADAMPTAQLRQALGQLKGRVDSVVAQLPSHEAFIAQYCKPD